MDINVTGILVSSQVGEINLDVAVLNPFQQLVYNDDFTYNFMNEEEFALPVRYWHKSINSWETYTVLFDDPTENIGLGAQVEFNSDVPQVQICEAHLKHRILRNDKCVVKGKTYLVDKYLSDGVGNITVYFRLK